MRFINFFAVTAIISLLVSCNNEPLEGDFATQNQVDCIEATQATVSAAQDFAEATDETFTELCIAYSSALEEQIISCGDPSGILQQTIDSLGDCMDDDDPVDTVDPLLIGTWEAVEFDAEVTSVSTSNNVETEVFVEILGSNIFYDLTFTETTFVTDGGYDATVTTTIDGNVNGPFTDSYTQVMGSGTYTTNNNVMTISGSFFEFDLNEVGNTAFDGEQTANYELTNNNNTLTFTQNETQTETSNNVTVTTTTVSTSVWNRF